MPSGSAYPIIYVRGFAGGTSGIDTATDDPFYGFEPPLVSYAPWFKGMAARREPINLDALNGPGPAGAAAVVDNPLPNPSPRAKPFCWLTTKP